jgi:hypothetical protein
MPTHFYYPTFYRRVSELDSFLKRHQKDLVDLNAITDPQLGQLNDLAAAVHAITTGSGWPRYRERA